MRYGRNASPCSLAGSPSEAAPRMTPEHGSLHRSVTTCAPRAIEREFLLKNAPKSLVARLKTKQLIQSKIERPTDGHEYMDAHRALLQSEPI